MCPGKEMTVAQLFCIKCGSELSDDSNFCQSCGQRAHRSTDTDEGFQLFYFKLSHRRRFYRTLWFLPFTLIGLFVNSFGLPGAFWFVVLLILWATQAIYEYTKWKNEE